MKSLKKRFIVLFAIGTFCSAATAQLSTLPSSIVDHYKNIGWIYFNPGTISNGDLFTTYYSSFFSGSGNSMNLESTWNDNILEYDHYRYQQYYQGIEVEGCEFIEHENEEGSLVYANGKICSQIDKRMIDDRISESEAFDKFLDGSLESTYWQDILAEVGVYITVPNMTVSNFDFAWEDQDWEDGLQTSTSNPNATYYPTGQLVFGLIDYSDIKYDMNPDHYTLSWKFDILCLNPDFHAEVYVDAGTGQIVKIRNLRHYDGPANVTGHGIKTLDTRSRGWPNNDFVLEANNGNHNIHTKIDGGGPWALTAEVDDDDDIWGSTQHLATDPHWMVTQAWDFFTTVYGRQGMHNFNTVRVRADENGVYGAVYDKVAGFNIIKVGYLEGGHYTADLAIMGHEFSHGVDQHEGKLEYWAESGALDESFADIFGFMTRRWVTNSQSWEIGVAGSNSRDRRNFKNPNSLGFHHLWNPTMDSVYTGDGQPDTYGGDYWFDLGTGNDAGGVHINSGVMNHWFYMLSMGEVGTNDLNDAYTINGIGIDKAAEISYYNFVNNMGKTSQYVDAAEGAIFAAILLHGVCSFEHIETENAWYAAGLGSWSLCDGASINENQLDFEIYPNPTTENLVVSFSETSDKTVQIYHTNGQLLKTFTDVNTNQFTIDVSYLSKGTYILSVIGTDTQWTKFVKQ